MKIQYFPVAVIATVISAAAQDSATFGPVPPPSNPPPLMQRTYLSSGAEDVLKLSTNKVNDEVIIGFVQSSNQRFSLSAAEILYLRKEGVSDQVLTAMLGQPAPAMPAAAPAPAPPMEASAPQYVAQPESTTVVETVPASTVYLAATPAYYSFYYDPWPYWYSWYAYPAFSVGFYWGWGWGNCGYWGYPYYCNQEYWNNCNNGYYPPPPPNGNPPPNGTRPTAAGSNGLIAEGRQPTGVSRERPFVSEMRQPSGVNQGTPLVSEGRQPLGVNQAAARSGFNRVENRSTGSTARSQSTAFWNGSGNQSTTTRPSPSQASAPSYRGSQGTAGLSANGNSPRINAARPVETRSANQIASPSGRNVGPTTTRSSSVSQRPAAPASVRQNSPVMRSTAPRTAPTTFGSRSFSPVTQSPNSSAARPTMNYQRGSSITPGSSYRPSVGGANFSRPSMGTSSRPSISPSFSSRGSASAGGMRSAGGFSGGGASRPSGGGGGRPR